MNLLRKALDAWRFKKAIREIDNEVRRRLELRDDWQSRFEPFAVRQELPKEETKRCL